MVALATMSAQAPPPVRIRLPALPVERGRTPFPIVATLAPVVMSLALFAITRSPYALMFAALGPGVAMASRLDSRRALRASRRSETERFEREFAEASAQLASAHAAERQRRESVTPSAAELVATPPHVRWGAVASPVLRLGTAQGHSEVVVDGAPHDGDRVVIERLRRLQSDARVLPDAPLVVAAARGVGVTGPAVLAEAHARALVVQLLAASPPSTHRVIGGAEWLDAVPHARQRGDARCVTVSGKDGEVTIATASEPAGLPRAVDTVVEIDADRGRSGSTTFVPEMLSTADATRWVAAAATVAERNALGPAGGSLPTRVVFDELRDDRGGSQLAGVLACPIGRNDAGIALLDLALDGPHAIVGGTTGSGKSEFLITWLLSLAARRSPAEVNFLLCDFKGGSSFGDIPLLPHCVGIVTDLDSTGAARAVASLAAEVRHRERVLADQGVRVIGEASGLPRLVIVVDEFAAMAAELPALHEQFADLAARGRSLGMHLVLCTQRPAGVVRDAVLANASLRVSLRVNNRADSAAVLGGADAAFAPDAPQGRAWVSRGGRAVEPVHIAISTASDVAAVVERWNGEWSVRRPWLDPLPPLLLAAELGGAIGLRDLPHEQAQRPLRWRPSTDGNLIVIGGARSGKSNVLQVVASTLAVDVVSDGVEAAWDALTDPGTVILLDDVDALLSRCGPDHQHALVELLTAALRSRTSRVAITAQRVTGSVQQLAALCDARLVLRMPDRQEHVLAGEGTGTFDPLLPPGGGHWHGDRVQIALASSPAPTRSTGEVAALPGAGETVLIVSTRLRQIERLMGERDRRVVELSSGPDYPSGAVVLTDPAGWQSHWSFATALLKNSPVLFHECSVSEFRQLSGRRLLPPPIDDPSVTSWLLTRDGDVERVSLR